MIGLIVVGTVGWNLTCEREQVPEPVYEGKPLSEWLLRFPPSARALNSDFTEGRILAIRSIGTNAVPWLLKWVRFQPQTWRTNLAAGAARLPRSIASASIYDWIYEGDARTRSQQASYTFGALGADAKMAYPELRAIATNSQGGFATEAAVEALVYCGVDAVPSILTMAANTNFAATRTIRRAEFFNNFSRRLTAYLNDSDPLVRQGATNIAKQVFPELRPKAPPN